MSGDSARDHGRYGVSGIRVRVRLAARGAAAVAAAGLVLGAAACGSSSPSSASGGGASASSSAAGGSGGSGGSGTGLATEAQQLAFARCMRSHGVSGFPDPNPGGGFGGRTQGVQSDPHFQSADAACRSLLPQSGGAKGQQNTSAFLQHAQCMRAHGIAGYPDPQPNVNPRTALQQAGIDMNSPQFQSASQTCDRLLPARGSGS